MGGCNPDESFAAGSPPEEDDLENAVNLQDLISEEVCPGWADPPGKLLSFGCSEALFRFPAAEVVGYDLDPFVVHRAQKRLGHKALVYSDAWLHTKRLSYSQLVKWLAPHGLCVDSPDAVEIEPFEPAKERGGSKVQLQH
eukprot:Skav230194  [mRNA]  locus=scaffold1418:260318:281652:+ [translate_table: standard]